MNKRIAQLSVYFKKNFRLFMNQKNWKFIVIAAVISFLVCSIVGKNMYKTFEDTQSGFFAITSAAIWVGIFNSIQRICKEHNTIASEYRSGLHISSYILSHVLFDFFVCLCQAAILMGICCAFIDFPSEGTLFAAIPEYFITLLLIIWGADIMGIMVSSVSSNPNVAMTAMPFVLILQLVMSGVLFKLEGWSEAIANITYSKWGMSALGSTADLNNGKSLPSRINEVDPMFANFKREYIEMYESEAGTILAAWGMIVLISAVCIVISILSLKFRNRNS
ncbi:MAG: ABC transporter permease [Ruminococcus sp.]|nr:ABC transporter permease [Ruminococcus sp.]